MTSSSLGHPTGVSLAIPPVPSSRLNVFMEKPIAVDGPTVRRMLALGEQAQRHSLKVAVGLMPAGTATLRKDLDMPDSRRPDRRNQSLRAYRMAGPTAMLFSEPGRRGRPNWNTRFVLPLFLWASGALTATS